MSQIDDPSAEEGDVPPPPASATSGRIAPVGRKPSRKAKGRRRPPAQTRPATSSSNGSQQDPAASANGTTNSSANGSANGSSAPVTDRSAEGSAADSTEGSADGPAANGSAPDAADVSSTDAADVSSAGPTDEPTAGPAEREDVPRDAPRAKDATMKETARSDGSVLDLTDETVAAAAADDLTAEAEAAAVDAADRGDEAGGAEGSTGGRRGGPRGGTDEAAAGAEDTGTATATATATDPDPDPAREADPDYLATLPPPPATVEPLPQRSTSAPPATRARKGWARAAAGRLGLTGAAASAGAAAGAASASASTGAPSGTPVDDPDFLATLPPPPSAATAPNGGGSGDGDTPSGPADPGGRDGDATVGTAVADRSGDGSGGRDDGPSEGGPGGGNGHGPFGTTDPAVDSDDAGAVLATTDGDVLVGDGAGATEIDDEPTADTPAVAVPVVDAPPPDALPGDAPPGDAPPGDDAVVPAVRRSRHQRRKEWHKVERAQRYAARHSVRFPIFTRAILLWWLLFALMGMTAGGTAALFWTHFSTEIAELREQNEDFEQRSKAAEARIDSMRNQAVADIDKRMQALAPALAEPQTVRAAGIIAPYVWFVNTLTEDGQAAVGTAFPVATDDKSTWLVTSYNVVKAGTVRPAPAITLRKDPDTAPAELVSWDAERDLALVRMDRPNQQILEWAPEDVQSKLVGNRVFVATGFGGVGATLNGAMVIDQNTKGLLHDGRIGTAAQGGPLLTTDGKVVGVASLAYNPLGFGGGELHYAVSARALCEKLLDCTTTVRKVR